MALSLLDDTEISFQEDELLVDKSLKFPSYKLWRPCQSNDLMLSGIEYQKLEKLSRVLHFNDYEDCFVRETIPPQPILDKSHSHLPEETYGSWFGVSQEGTAQGDHTWYGNVSFQIDFKKFLNEFHPNCYFIEVVEYRTTSAVRLLLTTRDIPRDFNVIEFDPMVRGGPWFVDSEGDNWYLPDCRRYENNDRNEYPAELEFFVFLSGHEYDQLYKICDIEPVNHSEANEPGYRKCKKYRSGGLHLQCPSDWTIEKCAVELDNFYESQRTDETATHS